MSEHKNIVISLGGSLVVPDHIDTEFLKNFIGFIKTKVEEGFRFVIVVGGGKTARRYQEALNEIVDASHDDKDWIGIDATRINAELVRIAFGYITAKHVVIDPTIPLEHTHKITIAAGWKPGWSTDYVSVVLAKQFGAKQVINLSNIDYAYDQDPKKFPDAKKIESITWPNYRKIIPEDWNPGLSLPFDPIASKRAEEEGIEVAIMNGANLENLDQYLQGQKFVGTLIK